MAASREELFGANRLTHRSRHLIISFTALAVLKRRAQVDASSTRLPRIGRYSGRPHRMRCKAGRTRALSVSVSLSHLFEFAVMGLLKLLQKLFSGQVPQEPAHEAPSQYGLAEITQRLKISVDELRALKATYRQFFIPKRRGGTRQILAPSDPLKAIQRRILRRLLCGLPCHAAARGFELGQSIVTNAGEHVGQAVIVRMDVKNFFASTRSDRITRYLQAIGWTEEASLLLTRLCTHDGGLPQGAPTSPRLSNLVNFRLDTRLTKLAERLGARYTRYADDLTFSFATDDCRAIHATIRMTKRVLGEEGYQIHQHKKLVIRRRNSRQLVTGLVVNEHANLPRTTRRWLRAVEYRAATGRGCTLTAEQLAGWQALRSMIPRGN